MSADVQRWDLNHDLMVMWPLIDGAWMRFTDHDAAVQAARDEGRNAAIDAVIAQHGHDDSCCSHGCTGMHEENWIQEQEIRKALALDPGMTLPPTPRCDESCNCSVAPFNALRKPVQP